VPDDVLVLPAHGEPFRGLHARLDDLSAGHERRPGAPAPVAADAPRRAIDVFGALFARRSRVRVQLLSMATGESLAHINHLVARGEAVIERDAQGVNWYRGAARS
jgi:hypothetical protein